MMQCNNFDAASRPVNTTVSEPNITSTITNQPCVSKQKMLTQSVHELVRPFRIVLKPFCMSLVTKKITAGLVSDGSTANSVAAETSNCKTDTNRSDFSDRRRSVSSTFETVTISTKKENSRANTEELSQQSSETTCKIYEFRSGMAFLESNQFSNHVLYATGWQFFFNRCSESADWLTLRVDVHMTFQAASNQTSFAGEFDCRFATNWKEIDQLSLLPRSSHEMKQLLTNGIVDSDQFWPVEAPERPRLRFTHAYVTATSDRDKLRRLSSALRDQDCLLMSVLDFGRIVLVFPNSTNAEGRGFSESVSSDASYLRCVVVETRASILQNYAKRPTTVIRPNRATSVAKRVAFQRAFHNQRVIGSHDMVSVNIPSCFLDCADLVLAADAQENCKSNLNPVSLTSRKPTRGKTPRFDIHELELEGMMQEDSVQLRTFNELQGPHSKQQTREAVVQQRRFANSLEAQQLSSLLLRQTRCEVLSSACSNQPSLRNYFAELTFLDELDFKELVKVNESGGEVPFGSLAPGAALLWLRTAPEKRQDLAVHLAAARAKRSAKSRTRLPAEKRSSRVDQSDCAKSRRVGTNSTVGSSPMKAGSSQQPVNSAMSGLPITCTGVNRGAAGCVRPKRGRPANPNKSSCSRVKAAKPIKMPKTASAIVTKSVNSALSVPLPPLQSQSPQMNRLGSQASSASVSASASREMHPMLSNAARSNCGRTINNSEETRSVGPATSSAVVAAVSPVPPLPPSPRTNTILVPLLSPSDRQSIMAHQRVIVPVFPTFAVNRAPSPCFTGSNTSLPAPVNSPNTALLPFVISASPRPSANNVTGKSNIAYISRSPVTCCIPRTTTTNLSRSPGVSLITTAPLVVAGTTSDSRVQVDESLDCVEVPETCESRSTNNVPVCTSTAVDVATRVGVDAEPCNSNSLSAALETVLRDCLAKGEPLTTDRIIKHLDIDSACVKSVSEAMRARGYCSDDAVSWSPTPLRSASASASAVADSHPVDSRSCDGSNKSAFNGNSTAFALRVKCVDRVVSKLQQARIPITTRSVSDELREAGLVVSESDLINALNAKWQLCTTNFEWISKDSASLL